MSWYADPEIGIWGLMITTTLRPTFRLAALSPTDSRPQSPSLTSRRRLPLANDSPQPISRPVPPSLKPLSAASCNILHWGSYWKLERFYRFYTTNPLPCQLLLRHHCISPCGIHINQRQPCLIVNLLFIPMFTLLWTDLARFRSQLILSQALEFDVHLTDAATEIICFVEG